jgi:hypothetical protein
MGAHSSEIYFMPLPRWQKPETLNRSYLEPLGTNRNPLSFEFYRNQFLKFSVEKKGKKVKLSLCLTNEALCHEGIWGSRCIDPHFFLTSALAGGEQSDSCPGHFTPWERAPSTHWIGGWVDPRAGLDNVEKRKFFTLPGLGLELQLIGHPACSQSLYRLTIPAHFQQIDLIKFYIIWVNLV